MRKKINISLFLISFSVFLYQVCLLRILSVSDFYHFAFLIVSVALLGFGISGSFLYFFINKIRDENLLYIIFSLGFSVSVIISFMAINLIPFDSFKIAWEIKQLFYLLVYYIFLISPFFFGGCFIGYVFYNLEKPSITYFFNLIGSAAGALAFLLLVPLTGKTAVIIISAIFGIIPLFILLKGKKKKIFIPVAVCFLIIVFILRVFSPQLWDLNISPYKSLAVILRYPDSEVVYSEEDSTARIDIVESENIRSAPGLSLKYQDMLPKQLGLNIDADNLSPVTEYSEKEMKFLEFMPQSIIFGPASKYKDILIIEPGGGIDVMASDHFTDSNIYVIQNNKLVVGALKENFSDFNGDLYNRDNIEVISTSVRNFSNMTEKKFDLIFLSLSENFHPISSGAYSLNENYNYTVECFRDLLKITGENGFIVITRWLQFPPSENLRVLSTLMETLEMSSIDNIPGSIYAFRSWSTVTTVFKKGSFLPGEIEVLKKKTGELNYDIVYYRGVKEEEVNKYNRLDQPLYYKFYREIIEGSRQERQSFYDWYYFNIEPVTDDSPYFYNFFKLRQVPDVIRYFGKSTQPFGGGGYLILIAALFISIMLSIFLILFPLKIKNIRLSLRGNYPYILYFLSIGTGFFFIELPFIQKFILILGNPAYSLSIILFSIMFFAGLGSYLTERIRFDIRWIISGLIGYIILFIFGFRYLSSFLLSGALWQRFLLTILLVMPAGLLMGMPFPIGIAAIKKKKPVILPWMWAINGCASVIGSIAAVIISLHLGFLVVIAISGFLYIGCAVAYRYF
jgi:hypothetical protein